MQAGQAHAHHDSTEHPHGGREHDGEHHRDHGHGHGERLITRLRERFVPHSHAAAEQIDLALESSDQGMRALGISLGVLMLTALLQAAVVAMSGSVSLMADAIHNFADALTALPLWIAFGLGRRSANRLYTYGYGRVEDVAGVIIVVIILASAVLAARESILRVMHPQPVANLGFVGLAALVGFLGNEVVAIYRIRVGTRIGSAALVADGYHARADGLTSLAVLVGAAGVALGYPILDPLVGLGITLAILVVTKNAAVLVWRRVLDVADPGMIEKLEGAARVVPGVQEVHDVRARWLGHWLEADLRLVVDGNLTTAQSHAIAESVRHALFHAEPRLSTIVVHTDPAGDHHHRETEGHGRPGRPGG